MTSTSSHKNKNNNYNSQQQRVAVIGGGVSGLAAAWHLQANVDHVDVQLFEAADRLGGHAHTVQVPHGNQTNGTVDVDIGFMVFNPDNYPNLVQWFQALSVASQDSDMSLSVSLDGGQTVEWNSDGLNGLLAKRSQAMSPAFYAFLRDMMRFHEQAPALLQLAVDDPRRQVTTAEYLKTHHYGTAFCQYYLLPMMAALWSASMTDVLNFPAVQLISFLQNHKMLQLFQRPQWKTVAGRSQVYTQTLHNMLTTTHLATPVTAVVQQNNNNNNNSATTTYQLWSHDQDLGQFDHVIFACHAPTARAILQAGQHPNAALLDLLGAVQYADNVVYVHSDPHLMPARRRAWASWNCVGQVQYLPSSHQRILRASSTKANGALEGGASGFGNTLSETETDNHNDKDDTTVQLEGSQGRMKAVYVTYWLNRLQSLETDRDIFVSLNPHQAPDATLTHHRLVLAHPQFTPATLQARQDIIDHHQGRDHLWFCGAWQGYGFHEDGCRSGFQVATALSGVPLPWGTVATPVLAPPDLSSQAAMATRTTTTPSMSMTNMLTWPWRATRAVTHFWMRQLPVYVCKHFVLRFLAQAVQHGQLIIETTSSSSSNDNDGGKKERFVLGDGTPCGCDSQPVVLRVFDDWFFVKVATEYDLGLARSYMAGHFNVQALSKASDYHPVIRPHQQAQDETNLVLGDPIGLTRLFLLLIGNRDAQHVPRKAAHGHWHSNALTNASGLVISRIGSFLNYVRYKLTMDNSERGGSLKNIHAHYDLSNDLFRTFLDKETLMYSSAIYDAVRAPSPLGGLVFRGSLEEAQWRKLDTLLARAQVQPGQTLLDIGFGWGGLSLHAAKKYGCRVTGITLSVEQKALALERVHQQGLQDLITFEVIDYRTFARQKRNLGKFDRVLSCEMIEAVGHEHLGEFFWAVEQVLAPNGILVMEAITTPEQRYETYLRSTDFINTIIFPGSCCPSLHALVDAAYQQSCLTLEHVDNIGLHYAETLAEWRRRFNANEATVRKLGFDSVFLRAWNYYLTYCEAGFFSQTENCLILVFARQGCASLAPLGETRCITQAAALTDQQVQNWLTETK